jgi:hypothetical protein
MTAIGYISDTKEMVNIAWSLCEQDGTAVFKLSEISPLPLPLSAQDLSGGQTQEFNVCWIQ